MINIVFFFFSFKFDSKFDSVDSEVLIRNESKFTNLRRKA